MICRHLEDRRIVTRTGKALWDNHRIKTMLNNETYAGTRYFNQTTATEDAMREGKKLIRGRIHRDRNEWIAVKVPAIVSRAPSAPVPNAGSIDSSATILI
jgi:Recombinase